MDNVREERESGAAKEKLETYRPAFAYHQGRVTERWYQRSLVGAVYDRPQSSK